MKSFHPNSNIMCTSSPTPIIQVCLICNLNSQFMYHDGGSNLICPNCLPKNDGKIWWKIRAEPEKPIPDHIVGKNPRNASCDAKFPQCTVSCTGINWKCAQCWGYDVCERCYFHFNSEEYSMQLDYVGTHKLTHPLVKIYDCEFPTYIKWEWLREEEDKVKILSLKQIVSFEDNPS